MLLMAGRDNPAVQNAWLLMIYVEQGGRCGNQLFSYAAARQLSELYGGERLCFDVSRIKAAGKKYGGEHWENVLPYFRTTEHDTVSLGVDAVELYGTADQKRMYYEWRGYRQGDRVLAGQQEDYARRREFFFACARQGLYYLAMQTFFPTELQPVLPLAEADVQHKFLMGNYEDRRWFEPIRSQLLRELQPREALRRCNEQLYDTICKTEAVCVSFRRWSIDALPLEERQPRELCGKDYYREAVRRLKSKIEKPVFFLFSDDVAWAMETFAEIAKGSPVYAEEGNDNVAEKLRLMSACRHFILANSTFSWWAQYLCKRPDKTVIAPNRFFSYETLRNPMIEDGWNLVEV